jgi:hypothetical protein
MTDIPKELENNAFIKSIMDRLMALSKENEVLKAAIAGKVETFVVDQNTGKAEKVSETKTKQCKPIMGVHEYVRIDTEHYSVCSMCDCRIGKNIQQSQIYFCQMDCLALYQSCIVNSLAEIRKKIAHKH